MLTAFFRGVRNPAPTLGFRHKGDATNPEHPHSCIDPIADVPHPTLLLAHLLVLLASPASGSQFSPTATTVIDGYTGET